MDPAVVRFLWIGGLGVAAAGTVTAAVVLTKKSPAAPTGLKLPTTLPPTAHPLYPQPSTSPAYPPPRQVIVPSPSSQSLPPPLTPTIPAGPYTELTGNVQLRPYETYLVSVPPTAGSLALFINSLSQFQPQLVVSQSWNGGPPPPGWPESDTSITNWRLVITNGIRPANPVLSQVTPAYTLPASLGMTVWTTQGQTS
jgi:hypothetical protein